VPLRQGSQRNRRRRLERRARPPGAPGERPKGAVETSSGPESRDPVDYSGRAAKGLSMKRFLALAVALVAMLLLSWSSSLALLFGANLP
jgi:hypothetical protein